VHLIEICCDSVDWIHSTQAKIQLPVTLRMAMNIRVI